MNNPWLAIARVLRVAANECELIATEATREKLDWIDQKKSPLGPRRHIAATRRRLSEGLDGAGQSGRRYLLSPEALAQELGRPTVEAGNEDDLDEVGELKKTLALVRGGSR